MDYAAARDDWNHTASLMALISATHSSEGEFQPHDFHPHFQNRNQQAVDDSDPVEILENCGL